MKEVFSQKERAVLAICQNDISFSATPYADIADAVGLTEEEVLDLLRRLKKSGIIRRFGASLRHQQAGWDCNAMVAWEATEEEANAAGPVAAANPRVSHAYYRPSSIADWPYSFYTMIHGINEADCDKVVEDLAQSLGLTRYAVLRSIRELKKTSMKYFS